MMENSRNLDLEKQILPEALPALIQYIPSKEVDGFDGIQLNKILNNQLQPSDSQPFSSSAMQGSDTAAFENQTDESQSIHLQRKHSVSISLPTSPVAESSKKAKKVLLKEDGEKTFVYGNPDSSAASKIVDTPPKQVKFHSQPMAKGTAAFEVALDVPNHPNNHPSLKKLKDKRYDSFKTWSGKLERQITNVRVRPRDDSTEKTAGPKAEKDALPVDRYFDALEGPELETLRAVRVNFFRGFKFSLSWWAYTFPMTSAAVATIRYSNEVTNVVTQVLAVIFSAVSTLTVSALLISTIVHAFVLQDLFPNDIAIAISNKKPRQHHQRKWFHLRRGSSVEKEIEHYFKFTNSDGKDIESSLDPTTSSSDSSH